MSPTAGYGCRRGRPAVSWFDPRPQASGAGSPGTRTIHSDESQEVMQKLREGFDQFELTWPIGVPEK